MLVPTFFLDDKPLVPQPAAVIVGGRTLLPVRALGDALGARVVYDGRTHTVTLTRSERRATLATNIVNGRAYAALRPLADALLVGITYDSTNRRLAIDTGQHVAARPTGSAIAAAGSGSPAVVAAATLSPGATLVAEAPVATYRVEPAITANPGAPPPPGSYGLVSGRGGYGLRNAYIVQSPRRGESSFDVVVHALPNGWGFVTTDAATVTAPLVFKGGDTFVGHVVVPSGIVAANAHAIVHFFTSEGTPVAYRVPTAFGLDTMPTPAPTADPSIPRRVPPTPGLTPLPAGMRRAL